MGEIILFDTQSQSFCYSTVPKNTIQYFSYDPLEDKADPNRMNCDLVFMKERRFGSYSLNTCFAILKKRDKNVIMKTSPQIKVTVQFSYSYALCDAQKGEPSCGTSTAVSWGFHSENASRNSIC